MTKPAPDTFWVLVNEPPFACDLEDLEGGLRLGVLAGRAYLDTLVATNQAPDGSSFAGLIYNPADPTDSRPIAAINLGGSDPSRYANAAGKVEWMLAHPGLTIDDAVEQQPWTIGTGEFVWGHAVQHRGFVGGGSGLSCDQDAEKMRVIINALVNYLQPLMTRTLQDLRAQGGKWVSGAPNYQYTYTATLCDLLMPNFVG